MELQNFQIQEYIWIYTDIQNVFYDYQRIYKNLRLTVQSWQ